MAMRILAIDPGFDRMGVAIVEGDGSKPVVVFSECVSPPKGDRELRLAYIQRAIMQLIEEYAPMMLVLESLYFSKNKKTALGVAEARGTVIATAGTKGVPVREIPPGTVKLAVTGNGRADKKAVAHMVEKLVKLEEKKRLDDELDAIAVGITALALRFPQKL